MDFEHIFSFLEKIGIDARKLQDETGRWGTYLQGSKEEYELFQSREHLANHWLGVIFLRLRQEKALLSIRNRFDQLPDSDRAAIVLWANDWEQPMPLMVSEELQRCTQKTTAPMSWQKKALDLEKRHSPIEGRILHAMARECFPLNAQD